jgi:2-oxoglutarate dehydrogenase E2 component (dihydrolipoamide succinyltransferase)
MPQLGETVQEGTIATWYKKVGDKIEKNETLLDVETDKAAVEVPAQEAGVITAINVEAGETVDVGVVLAVIAVEGEEADEVVEEKAPEVVAPVATAEVAATPAPAVSANPLAAQPSAMLSPAVRRLVADNSLDVSAISGTGKGGRVTKQDVLEFIAQPSTVATAPISAAAPAAMAAAPSAAPIAGDSRSVIPFDRIRKMTADHMVMSKATSPHVLQAVEVDYGNVDAVRKKLSPQWKADKGYSLTYLPFIAKAICKAIAEFPKMNSSVEGDSLRVHGLINLGIAVDLNHQGLVVPVVHDCASLSVGQIAERIKELSTKARNKKLTPDDMSGGTYTISNSGPFGTHITAPVISQPQIAIMSTDGIKKRPVVLESDLGDSIVIRPVGILAQSFDHRAIDGAYNAAFMNRVREILEQTNWAAEI